MLLMHQSAGRIGLAPDPPNGLSGWACSSTAQSAIERKPAGGIAGACQAELTVRLATSFAPKRMIIPTDVNPDPETAGRRQRRR